MMMLLQIAAAHMACVDKIVFHTVDRSGMDAFRLAQETFGQLMSAKDKDDNSNGGGGSGGSGGGRSAFRAAASIFRGGSSCLSSESVAVADSDNVSVSANKFISDVVDLKFRWGVSNGT